MQDDPLRRGRAAYARRAWAEAHDQLAAADDDGELEPDDVERLAMAAYLAGRDAACERQLVRAHEAYLQRDDPKGAVRCAFWLGFALLQRGQTASGGGWLGRARRLCEERQLDCAERGYVLVAAGLMQLEGGDAAAAEATFELVFSTGDRFGDTSVMTLGRLGRGQALVRMGRTEEGVALFDETMVAVTAGEVSVPVAGIVYCAVIDECQRIYDVGRAQEWTAALDRWCDAQPDLVPYRGQCLVHRAQLLQLHGAWRDAMEKARQAGDRLSDPPRAAAGMAYYELGELHRLRGGFGEAEAAYGLGHELGRPPHPGLALAWLAQGRTDTAAAAISQAVADASDDRGRCELLPAHVEIMLAIDRVDVARRAADRLSALAEDLDAPMLRAVAERALGAVLIAEGDPRAAIGRLRPARETWRRLAAPYEAARTQLLIGTACQALDDEGTAELELEAARRVFAELGAAPALAEAERLLGRADGAAPAAVTAREVEVLRLVAAGMTNRQIAAELVISDRTVERHLSNVFTKLGVSNRAAATAYAYEHDLV